MHQIGCTGKTPSSWKSYYSLLLFKKPTEYQPGDEKLLKKFRPIALANVSYKLLTSILASRLSKWLEANKGISWSQRTIFIRNVVQLIQNLYNGCSSLPISVEKKPHCDPIPIKRGVKQGSNMSSSSLIFT